MTLNEAIEEEKTLAVVNCDMATTYHTYGNAYSRAEEAYRAKAEYHAQIAEWLKELKQLREQTRWIPVKERLPEEGTECLVTVLHREPYSFEYQYKVTEAFYAEYWGLFDDDYSGDRILAWLPLPEPYKTESEG